MFVFGVLGHIDGISVFCFCLCWVTVLDSGLHFSEMYVASFLG